MTLIEVSAETIVALGGALEGVADDLQWQALRSSEQTWALGPGDSAGALASVLGDFEHQRQVLGRELSELSTRATQAGRLYADVELDDSATYDALTGLSRGAGGVGSTAGTLSLFPTFKPLAVVAALGDGVQVASDAAVKVGYGDWSMIALTAGASATGPVSGVLKRAALATNPAALGAETRTARRLLRYDTGQRLRLGLADEVRWAGRTEPDPGARIFRATWSPGSPAATAHWAREQLVGRAQVLALNKWVDDLVLVTGDPARSRTLMVTGLGAEVAADGLDTGAKVRGWYVGQQEQGELQARDDAATKGPPRPR